MIVRGRKETVGDVIAGLAMQKDQEKVLSDDDNKSALSFLDDNEFLILPDPIDLSITGFFLLEDNSDHIFTLKFKACKPKSKVPPPTNRAT